MKPRRARSCFVVQQAFVPSRTGVFAPELALRFPWLFIAPCACPGSYFCLSSVSNACCPLGLTMAYLWYELNLPADPGAKVPLVTRRKGGK